MVVKRAPSTRARILDLGANLVSTSGLEAVTLGPLAKRSGLSKSGLFAHFGSKEEVQLALLDRTAQLGAEHIVAPAMRVAEGLPRLKAIVRNWLGWTARSGLPGGCPVAAAVFEFDDREGPVRERVFMMEKSWRDHLRQLVTRAIELGHLRRDLDVEQFVWQLCGIYLSHHVSLRFLRDPLADKRAQAAFDSLLQGALPKSMKAPSPGARLRRIHHKPKPIR